MAEQPDDRECIDKVGEDRWRNPAKYARAHQLMVNSVSEKAQRVKFVFETK